MKFQMSDREGNLCDQQLQIKNIRQDHIVI